MKPEYDAGKNLKEQLDAAVAFYNSEMSLQAIGDELGLNPIKVRKLLITAGVYESEVAQKVQDGVKLFAFAVSAMLCSQCEIRNFKSRRAEKR